MSISSNNSYAVIPCYIMDDDTLEPGAQMLYARLSMLANEGRAWPSNKYLAEKQKVTTRCIQNWLKQLSDAKYIEIELIKTGFQTKRNIWLDSKFKEMFTKRTTVRAGVNHSSCRGEPQFTHINTIDKEIYKAFGAFVKLRQEEYESLCKDNGKEKTDDIIERINDYCVNNKPKGYTCYRAAFNTFLKNYKPRYTPQNKQDSPKDKIMKILKHGELYNGAECIINSECVALQRGMKNEYVRFKEKGFSEMFHNMLRKFEITGISI